MPIYDYECKDCGIIPDVWAQMAEEIINCPHCGEPAWRLMSAPNLNLDIPIMGQFEPNIAHPDKAPHGTWIESKQHRDKICQEYGITINK